MTNTGRSGLFHPSGPDSHTVRGMRAGGEPPGVPGRVTTRPWRESQPPQLNCLALRVGRAQTLRPDAPAPARTAGLPRRPRRHLSRRTRRAPQRSRTPDRQLGMPMLLSRISTPLMRRVVCPKCRQVRHVGEAGPLWDRDRAAKSASRSSGLDEHHYRRHFLKRRNRTRRPRAHRARPGAAASCNTLGFRLRRLALCRRQCSSKAELCEADSRQLSATPPCALLARFAPTPHSPRDWPLPTCGALLDSRSSASSAPERHGAEIKHPCMSVEGWPHSAPPNWRVTVRSPGHIRPKSAQIWWIPGQLWPKSVEGGTVLANFGPSPTPVGPNLGLSRSIPAKAGRTQSSMAQTWPIPHQSRPRLSRVWTTPANVGRFRHLPKSVEVGQDPWAGKGGEAGGSGPEAGQSASSRSLVRGASKRAGRLSLGSQSLTALPVCRLYAAKWRDLTLGDPCRKAGDVTCFVFLSRGAPHSSRTLRVAFASHGLRRVDSASRHDHCSREAESTRRGGGEDSPGKRVEDRAAQMPRMFLARS